MFFVGFIVHVHKVGSQTSVRFCVVGSRTFVEVLIEWDVLGLVRFRLIKQGTVNLARGISDIMFSSVPPADADRSQASFLCNLRYIRTTELSHATFQKELSQKTWRLKQRSYWLVSSSYTMPSSKSQQQFLLRNRSSTPIRIRCKIQYIRVALIKQPS